MWNVLGRGYGSLEAVLATVPKWILTRPNQTTAPTANRCSLMMRHRKSRELASKTLNRGNTYRNDDVRWDGLWGARPEPIHKC